MISYFICRLYKAAEEARLPKRLRADLGGALKEFTYRESHCFAQAKEDGAATLFTSQERQWLVLQVLQGLRAGRNDLEALQGRAAVEEGQSIGKPFCLLAISTKNARAINPFQWPPGKKRELSHKYFHCTKQAP